MSSPSQVRWPLWQATRGKGALISLALLFLMSGALRMLDGAATAASGMIKDDPAPRQELSEAPRGIDEDALAAAMSELRERERRLQEAERALADRVRALEIAETTIDQKMNELTEAEQRLRATMSSAQTAADDDVARLTAVYENMKPKEAALVFAQMPPDFAAGFLGRMRPDAAAEIMSGLEPEKAFVISVLLAGRNANAPRE